jgi:hypothetical protein
LKVVLSPHLLLYCSTKDIPALKGEREFTFLVGVLCMKRRKIEDLDEREVKFLLFITRINCLDDGVVRKSLRRKMSVNRY